MLGAGDAALDTQDQARVLTTGLDQAAATAKDAAIAGGGGPEGLTNAMSMFSGYQ